MSSNTIKSMLSWVLRSLTTSENLTIFWSSSILFMFLCCCLSIASSIYIFLQEASRRASFQNARCQSVADPTTTFLSFWCFTWHILSYLDYKSNMGSIVINVEIDWWNDIIGLTTTSMCFLLGFLFCGNLRRYQTGQQQRHLYLFFTGWNLKI